MTFGRKFYEPLADGAPKPKSEINNDCLLYTSDAADE